MDSFIDNSLSETEGEMAIKQAQGDGWKGHRFVITGPSPRPAWGENDLRGVAKGEPYMHPMKGVWYVDILVDGFGVVTVPEGVCVEEKYFQDGMQRNGDKWVIPAAV